MEDILKEFIAETSDHLDSVAAQLVQFEQEPGDAKIIASIFRLVHTIKGTCGFLGLPRLANIAHAAETLLGRIRDGSEPTRERVSLILSALDRIKLIIGELESCAVEPEGSDSDLISAIDVEVGDHEQADISESELDAMAMSPSAVEAPKPAATEDHGQQLPGAEPATAQPNPGL